MSSEFKGTPGPWHMDRNNVHTGQIATIHHCIGNDWVEIWSPDWPDTEEKQEANARLIASSPRLLEVAISLLEALEFENPKAYSDIIDEARAEIAKALGESQ